jgi:hypothetical protein
VSVALLRRCRHARGSAAVLVCPSERLRTFTSPHRRPTTPRTGGRQALRNAPATKVRPADAYIVKAAESRPSPVAAKANDRPIAPSGEDKRLAHALLKTPRAS